MSDGGKGGSNEPTLGRARDHISKQVGLSPTTYQRAKKVIEEAPDELKEKRWGPRANIKNPAALRWDWKIGSWLNVIIGWTLPCSICLL